MKHKHLLTDNCHQNWRHGSAERAVDVGQGGATAVVPVRTVFGGTSRPTWRTIKVTISRWEWITFSNDTSDTCMHGSELRDCRGFIMKNPSELWKIFHGWWSCGNYELNWDLFLIKQSKRIAFTCIDFANIINKLLLYGRINIVLMKYFFGL